MLPDGALRANHVWKRFRAERSRSTIKDPVRAVRQRLRRNDGWLWVLRDIDFDLEPGGALGLVGSNGSGKSTLLKILTQVMFPYAGSVEAGGRVGALIEVAGGLHGQLTGRENVFLHGSLLGIPRKEIAKRFDEIVAFAELENAIDRLVKFYSSGMRMRLGFSIAAFLEPDVLLVDEVLAVGDASFQHKCLERMRTMLGEGTTLVLVSHDLQAVESTCKTGIWLRNGEIESTGAIGDVLSGYRQAIEEEAELASVSGGPVKIRKITVTGPEGLIRTQDRMQIELDLESDKKLSCAVFLGVSDGPSAPIFSLRREMHLSKGRSQAVCTVDNLPLPRGRFYIWMSVVQWRQDLVPWRPVASFEVIGPKIDPSPVAVARRAPIFVPSHWEVAEDQPSESSSS